MPYRFLTGGASSGKSGYALQLFSGRSDVTFIATSLRTDAEMERRIASHRRERPPAGGYHSSPSAWAGSRSAGNVGGGGVRLAGPLPRGLAFSPTCWPAAPGVLGPRWQGASLDRASGLL